MTTEQADDMVDRDLTVTEARAEAFEAMQTPGPPGGPGSRHRFAG